MKSVRNAIKALQLFSVETPSISVSDVSAFLKIPKSSASRMLAAMQDSGIIEREHTRGLYKPGLLAFKLGTVYSAKHSSRQIIRTAMHELAAETRHSCWVSTLSGTDVVVLESVHGGYPVRLVVESGSRLPAHVAAGGKALLARLDNEQIRDLYPSGKLKPYTKHTLRGLEQLLPELAEVRKRGWAETNQEVVDGIKSIGVSFRALGEVTCLSLSVSFPLTNVTKPEETDLRGILIRIAENLGSTIGDAEWVRRIEDKNKKAVPKGALDLNDCSLRKSGPISRPFDVDPRADSPIRMPAQRCSLRTSAHGRGT